MSNDIPIVSSTKGGGKTRAPRIPVQHELIQNRPPVTGDSISDAVCGTAISLGSNTRRNNRVTTKSRGSLRGHLGQGSWCGEATTTRRPSQRRSHAETTARHAYKASWVGNSGSAREKTARKFRLRAVRNTLLFFLSVFLEMEGGVLRSNLFI